MDTGWDMLRGYRIIDGLKKPHFGYQMQKEKGKGKREILKMLDWIQSVALRLALGALRTSPTLSLCAEAGVPPLQFPHCQIPSIHGSVLSNPYFFSSLCPLNSLRLSLESISGANPLLLSTHPRQWESWERRQRRDSPINNSQIFTTVK